MNRYILLLSLISYAQVGLSQIQLGSDIDGQTAYDYSGWSVSLSSNGQRVAIGATEGDFNGIEAGYVRIFEYTGGQWMQLGSDIDGESGEDYSGFSVSLSADGQRVAIGAPYNDGNGSRAGNVRVYEYLGGHWIQLGTNINGEINNEESGSSVSLSANGQRVAVGAPGHNGNGGWAGYVRVFEYLGGQWTQLGAGIYGEAGNGLGHSVSLSADGQRMAIGATDGDGIGAARVGIFEFFGNQWTQLGSDIDGGAIGDESGFSVSLSADGQRVAIGAPATYLGNGHVRIFEYLAGQWTQLGSTIIGEEPNDWEGYSVSLSADGQRVAIGAPANSGNGLGFFTGHVRIFEYLGGQWTQLGSDIDGVSQWNWLGHTVSLSADGQRVAIGAPYHDSQNSFAAGQVRIYDLSSVVSLTDPFDTHLKLYPNPTSGTINFVLPEDSGLISIHDTQGNLINNIAVNQKEMQVTLESYSAGVYLIQIDQNGIKYEYEVILKK